MGFNAVPIAQLKGYPRPYTGKNVLIDLDSDNETSLPKAHSFHDQYLKEVIESVKMKMKQQSYSFYKSNNQQFWIRPPDPTFIQQYETDGKISPIHFYNRIFSSFFHLVCTARFIAQIV